MLRNVPFLVVGLLPVLACKAERMRIAEDLLDAAAGPDTPAAGGVGGLFGGTGGTTTATTGAVAPDVPSDPPGSISDQPTSQPDVGPVTGVPKGFRFNNQTGQTVYVRADPPVDCQQQGLSGLETCNFFPACMLSCADVAKLDGNCYLSCPAIGGLFVIAPGASCFQSWPGTLHQGVRGTCTLGVCDNEVPVPSQSFQASIAVYTDYVCNSPPCILDNAGVLYWAFGQGASTTYVVPFSIPYPNDEIAFDINPS